MNTNPTPDVATADAATPDDPTADPASQLQRQITLQLVHDLLDMLPAPLAPKLDQRTALECRIKTAAALAAAALAAAVLPATAEEADLAVRVPVAGNGQWSVPDARRRQHRCDQPGRVDVEKAPHAT